MITEAKLLEPRLSVDAIRRDLFTYTIARRLLLYDTVESTNAVLHDLAKAGAPEGTVVLADEQTAGRGRAGKVWFSPPGVNLYASVLLRPQVAVAEAGPLAFAPSLALADAIRELGLAPAIKWPNDVLVQRRKVSGTLTELVIAGDRVEYLILGIGVNVNVGHEGLRRALGPAAQAATSLREALGRPVDRNALAAAYLAYLDEWLVIYREQGAPPLLRAWRERDILVGRRIEVREGVTVFGGRARGLDVAGHLEVETDAGQIRRVVSGDIRLME
jgi:BirA family transcriptional regulator, biotin operon repressor / biotin---[acetyl-CoA-carboxylase] ligase